MREPNPAPTVPDLLDPGATHDFTGAIYGSLLVASTIVGTAASFTVDTDSAQLLAAIVVTSVVFWLMHVYVRVVGHELPRQVPVGLAIRHSVSEELPILWAVLPSSLLILTEMLLDVPGDRVAWGALWVALGGQVVWTWLSLRQTHARGRVQVLSMAVSVALGLVLVGLKVALSH
jgi:hypothetical protein